MRETPLTRRALIPALLLGWLLAGPTQARDPAPTETKAAEDPGKESRYSGWKDVLTRFTTAGGLFFGALGGAWALDTGVMSLMAGAGLGLAGGIALGLAGTGIWALYHYLKKRRRRQREGPELIGLRSATVN